MSRDPGVWWEPSIVALVFATLLYAFAGTRADPDLYGHLRFGLDLLETGTPVRADPYSFLTAGRPWVNHEWLAEGVFALCYRLAGSPGLIALKVALGLGAFALAFVSLRAERVSALGAGLLVLVCSLPMLPWLFSVRPQVFSYLLFSLTILVIVRAERGAIRWVLVLPAVMAVWANLHGGFLAGLGVLLPWAVVRALRRGSAQLAPADRWLVLGSAAGAALATLLNPYGLRLWMFLRTALTARREIAEWNPVDLAGVEGLAYLFVLGLASAGLVYSRRMRSPLLAALFIVAAALPLIARRHTPLFVLAALMLAGPHLADAADRWASSLVRGLLGVQARAGSARDVRPWLGWVFVAATTALVWLSAPQWRQIRVDPDYFPVRAVQLLKESGVGGNMVVFFDWGEYVLWQLGPRVRVSMDGRRETLYSDEVYRQSLKLTHGLGDWDSLLREPAADLVLFSKAFAAVNLLKQHPDWSLVFEDGHSALFVRHRSSLAARLRDARAPAPVTTPFLAFP